MTRRSMHGLDFESLVVITSNVLQRVMGSAPTLAELRLCSVQKLIDAEHWASCSKLAEEHPELPVPVPAKPQWLVDFVSRDPAAGLEQLSATAAFAARGGFGGTTAQDVDDGGARFDHPDGLDWDDVVAARRPTLYQGAIWCDDCGGDLHEAPPCKRCSAEVYEGPARLVRRSPVWVCDEVIPTSSTSGSTIQEDDDDDIPQDPPSAFYAKTNAEIEMRQAAKLLLPPEHNETLKAMHAELLFLRMNTRVIDGKVSLAFEEYENPKIQTEDRSKPAPDFVPVTGGDPGEYMCGMHATSVAQTWVHVDRIREPVLRKFALLSDELAKVRRQLPDGMKHCTIVCRRCPVGHAWLTATNWVQHECPTCELELCISTARKGMQEILETQATQHRCADCRHYWDRRSLCSHPTLTPNGEPGRPWAEPETCAPPWCPGFEPSPTYEELKS